MENAKAEFTRLQNYIYADSNSPAPKATTPFIRLCGDYREINKYIKCPADSIPYPLKKIQGAQKFLYFCDIDMTNNFHQFLLDEDTSSKLSIQTELGLVRPRFMPEGISPASMLLQRTVLSIFADFGLDSKTSDLTKHTPRHYLALQYIQTP